MDHEALKKEGIVHFVATPKPDDEKEKEVNENEETKHVDPPKKTRPHHKKRSRSPRNGITSPPLR